MLLENNLERPWLIGTGEHLCAWLFCEHLVVVEFPGSVLRLYSPSAAALWLLLSDQRTLPSLIDSMVDLYAADQAHIQQSVGEILSEWTALGWLKLEQGQYQLTYQCSTPSCEPMHASYSGSRGEYAAKCGVQFAIPMQITIEACAGAAPQLIFDRLYPSPLKIT